MSDDIAGDLLDDLTASVAALAGASFDLDSAHTVPRLDDQEAPVTRSKSATAEKDRRCLELRRMGLTLDEIATQVGYANKGSVSKALAREAKRSGGPEMDPDRARELEADRLDRLQAAVWPKAMKGDPIAVEKVLRISQARRSLLGLDRALLNVTPERPAYAGGDAEASVTSADEMEELRRRRAADSAARAAGTPG